MFISLNAQEVGALQIIFSSYFKDYFKTKNETHAIGEIGDAEFLINASQIQFLFAEQYQDLNVEHKKNFFDEIISVLLKIVKPFDQPAVEEGIFSTSISDALKNLLILQENQEELLLEKKFEALRYWVINIIRPAINTARTEFHSQEQEESPYFIEEEIREETAKEITPTSQFQSDEKNEDIARFSESSINEENLPFSPPQIREPIGEIITHPSIEVIDKDEDIVAPSQIKMSAVVVENQPSIIPPQPPVEDIPFIAAKKTLSPVSAGNQPTNLFANRLQISKSSKNKVEERLFKVPLKKK